MTQVSPDMVEAAGRAMLAAHDWTTDIATVDGNAPQGFDSMPKDWQDAYRKMAAAALTAALGDTHVIVEKEREPAPGHGYSGAFTAKEFNERALDHDKAARNGLAAGPNVSYVRTFQACAVALRLAADLLPAPTPEQQQ